VTKAKPKPVVPDLSTLTVPQMTVHELSVAAPVALFCARCGRPEEEYNQCGGYPVMPCGELVPADPATTVTLYCTTHDVTRTGKAVDIMRGKADLSHLCSPHCTVTVILGEGVTPKEPAPVSLDQAPPQVPASDAIIRDPSLSETKPEGAPVVMGEDTYVSGVDTTSSEQAEPEAGGEA
jgi:hypothetical protein